MNDDIQRPSLCLGEVLLIVFIVLKLCGVIHWSWWWVLSPIWIEAGLAVVITLIELLEDLLIINKNLNEKNN